MEIEKIRKLTEFGLEVRKALLEKGISIAEMTRTLGFKSEHAIRDMLYGDRSGLKYRNKIIEFLGLDIQSNENIAANE